MRENRTSGSIGGRWPEDPGNGATDEKANRPASPPPNPDQQPAANLTTDQTQSARWEGGDVARHLA